jgi:hypothetical protein
MVTIELADHKGTRDQNRSNIPQNNGESGYHSAAADGLHAVGVGIDSQQCLR